MILRCGVMWSLKHRKELGGEHPILETGKAGSHELGPAVGLGICY